ncbi:MAG: PKD repeat protein, partial [Saprospiraceae bacterium]
FHRINNPNWKGEACDVDQHSIVIPTSIGRGVPNFPNFRLGPLDDNPADTLGLNNHPVAKFRYVQDTLEDLRVHFFDLSYYDPEDYLWDFGDGNTSDELEPNHAYAEKGVYEVCLTVSNIYDTSTSCKTIMLGTTSTIDKELAVDVSIYPNPTSDYLTINFHNYIALDGMVRFYDVSGREVKSVVLERASTILDLQNLPSGAYLYKVYDEGDELYTGQVVVVK